MNVMPFSPPAGMVTGWNGVTLSILGTGVIPSVGLAMIPYVRPWLGVPVTVMGSDPVFFSQSAYSYVPPAVHAHSGGPVSPNPKVLGVRDAR